MAYIDNVKNWFKTGLKPTQDQFYAKFAWLRWKDEKIPLADINDIEGILNAKAEAAELTDHLTSASAHADQFNAKEDKTKKGQANGYVPLNEVVQIASQYLNIIDDVVSGGSDGLLSAEQGKVLKIEIDAINTLLASDNVDLDNVQELVDAIETLQTSLETILVNDLTTGGVTKALTAEMGKSLKALIDGLNTNKADKTALDSETQNRADADDAINERIDDLETSFDAEFDMYQLINNQIYVNESGLVQDSWHGKLVTFTANVTITVPSSGLRTGFNFEGIVDPTVTVNTTITAPKTWSGAYSGAAIPENSIFTFIQRSNNSNKISIYGL